MPTGWGCQNSRQETAVAWTQWFSGVDEKPSNSERWRWKDCCVKPCGQSQEENSTVFRLVPLGHWQTYGFFKVSSWWELRTSNCWDTQHSTDMICDDWGSVGDSILKEFVQKINGDLKHVIWSGASSTAAPDFPFLPSNSAALINALSVSQPHRYSGLLVRYPLAQNS